MSLMQIQKNNPNVDFILSEISKLSSDEREVVRMNLSAEYWQNHIHELVQQPATEEEMSLGEIDNIKHQSRKATYAQQKIGT
jgi:hypothetical protein